eukprot:sb/3478785/
MYSMFSNSITPPSDDGSDSELPVALPPKPKPAVKKPAAAPKKKPAAPAAKKPAASAAGKKKKKSPWETSSEDEDIGDFGESDSDEPIVMKKTKRLGPKY